MTDSEKPRVIAVTEDIAAPAATIFELIADPARQPEWDGNNNLASAAEGQRVLAVGDVFAMNITTGSVRENRVVEFEEGRRIAWQPSPLGKPAPGHTWRWEIEATGENSSRVTHTYDWTQLDPNDEGRIAKATSTGEAQLAASVSRLKALAESLA
jgi:uncharacterized protein YndB with AHSA1/START domain